MSYFWRPFVGTSGEWHELWGRCDSCFLSGPATEFVDMIYSGRRVTVCRHDTSFPGCAEGVSLSHEGWTIPHGWE